MPPQCVVASGHRRFLDWDWLHWPTRPPPPRHVCVRRPYAAAFRRKCLWHRDHLRWSEAVWRSVDPSPSVAVPYRRPCLADLDRPQLRANTPNLRPIRPGCLVNCRVGVFAVALLNTSPIGKEQLEACQLPLLCREVYRGVAVRAPGIRVGAGIDRCLHCNRVSCQCRCPNGLYLAKRLAKRGAQKHNQDQ